MATSRATAKGTTDEEFLQQLYRGGELLAAGKVIEAKDYLERAYALQPKNEKGQNLLGLTYFKLGLFDRAAEIYEGLVRENPADPTLRVNLGLVYLKTNALQRAIREFETATDLSPEHTKAHNYLGLALAQVGDYRQAREHFLAAGSEAMAEKMERAMAGEGFARPAPASPARQAGFAEIEGSEVVVEKGGIATPNHGWNAASGAQEETIEVMSESEPPPSEAVEEIPLSVSSASGAALTSDWGAQFGLDAPPDGQAASPAATEELRFAEDEGPSAPAVEAPPEAEVMELPADQTPALTQPEDGLSAAFAPVLEAQPHEIEEPPAVEASWSGSDEAYPAGEAPEMEAEVSAPVGESGGMVRVGAGLLQLAPTLNLGPEPGPFEVGTEAVAIAVAGEILSRLVGVVAFGGGLAFQPEMRRFRGRPSDKPFGEGAERLMRLTGSGVVYVDPGKARFVAVPLEEDSAYFREDAVFAFEEALMFENGRMPSDVPPDLDLVHLRGKGSVLLRLAGGLRSLPVAMDRPVTVPLSRLVGWAGNVSPRVVPFGGDEQGTGASAAVELTGEGLALLTVPMG